VQIGEQVVDLVLGEHLPEAFHLVAAHAHDVADAVIIGGHAALAQVLVLEHAFQAGSLAIFGRVGGVAAVAVLIVDVPTGNLLRSQAKLSIAAPAFDLASKQSEKEPAREGDGHDLPILAESVAEGPVSG